LIEPILRALGWDVEDLDEVRKEFRYKPGDNPVDYALFLLRTPRLFVEAKALGENLSDRKWASQIMGYAGVAGVEWVVLTDGNEYRIYNAHAAVDIEKKLFRRIVIAADESGVVETLALLSKSQLQETQIEVLWRADFVDRQVKGAIEGLFATDLPPDFLHLIRKRVPALPIADVRASLARARFTLDYPAVQLAPAAARAPVRGPADIEVAPIGTAEQGGHVDKTPWRSVTLVQIIAAGLVGIPLEIEHRYRGTRLTARIEAADRVVFSGAPYDSLSTAGGMARKSVAGPLKGPAVEQTNGWTFWEYRTSDGTLRTLDALRRELHEHKVVSLDGKRTG
jgi:hypothetical protein